MARKVFYSFHYSADSWRAATVRNIGSIEGNPPAKDNDWESVTRGGDSAIKTWIAGQMTGRTCTVVLVGTDTANRKWINHEIVRAWDQNMGLVGIHVHGLKNSEGLTSVLGANPFDFITHGPTGTRLSAIAKCYMPGGVNSQERYNWISTYLSDAVEEAIRIREQN